MSEQLKQKTLSPLVAVVDIETASTRVDAVIATIGCVVVDVLTGKELGTFYRRCNYKAQEVTRHTCDETLAWWMKIRIKYPQAYEEVANYNYSDRIRLADALMELNAFLVAQFGDVRIQVMGNGPEFDNAILLHAMTEFGIKPAWNHGGNQSLRTAVMFGRLLLDYDPKYELEFEGIQHHALDDARHEAKYLHLIISEFQNQLMAKNGALLNAFSQGFMAGYNQEESLIHPEIEATEQGIRYLPGQDDESVTQQAIAELYTRLAHENDNVKRHLTMIDDLREGLQSLYANHGEDENVAAICNPLIEKSRLVV